MTSPMKPVLPKSVTNPLRGVFAFVSVYVLVLSFWAFFAPLMTTIHVSGHVQSQNRSYNIQHEFGGSISRVFVRFQDTVWKGDPLLEFNVSYEIEVLDGLKSLAEKLKKRINAIESQLNGKIEYLVKGQIEKDDYLEISATQIEVQEHKAKAQNHLSQVQILRAQQDLKSQQIEIHSMQLIRLEDLAQSGLVSEDELNESRLRKLSARDEYESLVSAEKEEQKKANSALILAENTKVRHFAKALKTLDDTKRQLIELEEKRIAVQQKIDSSIVVSPVSGTIQAIAYTTPQMYVPRGETIARVAQILESPEVRIEIPAQSIDQVEIGMQGKLSFPSLPQRDLPPVRLKLKSISPESQTDSDGNPTGYIALAEIDQDDLLLAQGVLGTRFKLSADMPVNVTFSGRSVTLFDYVVRPFFSIFDGALQD